MAPFPPLSIGMKPTFGSYTGAVGPGYWFTAFETGTCREFLEDEGTDTNDWPQSSSDLNPIEHFWDNMFCSIRQHQVSFQTFQELSDALVQI